MRTLLEKLKTKLRDKVENDVATYIVNKIAGVDFLTAIDPLSEDDSFWAFTKATFRWRWTRLIVASLLVLLLLEVL